MVTVNIQGLPTLVAGLASRRSREHWKPQVKIEKQLVFPFGKAETKVVVGYHPEPGACVFFGLVPQTEFIAKWQVRGPTLSDQRRCS